MGCGGSTAFEAGLSGSNTSPINNNNHNPSDSKNNNATSSRSLRSHDANNNHKYLGGHRESLEGNGPSAPRNSLAVSSDGDPYLSHTQHLPRTPANIHTAITNSPVASASDLNNNNNNNNNNTPPNISDPQPSSEMMLLQQQQQQQQQQLQHHSPQHSPQHQQQQSNVHEALLSSPTSSLSYQENQRVGQLLKSVPLLQKLTDQERAKLGGCLVEKAFSDHERIINQGDIGNGFFIINKGEVLVTRFDGLVESELARLKDGDFFGETALITQSERGASVIAVGSVLCWYLNADHFHSLFGKDRLNVQFAKRTAISAEKFNSVNANNNDPQVVNGGSSMNMMYTPKIPANAIKLKTANTVQLIHTAMKDNVLFMNLDAEHKAQIIAEMYRAEIKAGTSAIRQGELGDNLYVVESGEFHVYVNGKKVAVRGKGSCFGELALMYNAPRAATVTAVIPSVVWVVDRFTFRRIVTDLSERKFNAYLSFLKKVELLAPLADYERKKIAEALEEVSYPSNYTIMKQGEMGDSMYLIHSGEVKIMKIDSNNSNETKEVNRYQTGDYFGERALLMNEPRAATAISQGSVHLLKLDRNAFHLLLGPLEDIMKTNMGRYNDKEKLSPTTTRTPFHKSNLSSGSVSPSSTYILPKIEDLQVIATLGKGSFGFVQLVQDRNNPATSNGNSSGNGGGMTYALKAVSKAQIVQTGQQGHVMSEKRVMACMNHPFLIRLYGTYKDKNRLFFLLEPSLGGELFSVLRERTLFDEDTARFYAASVVLAFEYMHDLNIIYRDLKPENLLLDSQGFLKVTDFGFAKDISSGRTWTLCGTPDYLAPEIVAGKGHGKGVDWWTLGVFIYEMLASYPPFYDEDPMKTYAKIMQGNITYPSHFSREAVDLISKLLQHKATKRLGVLKGGAKLIKEHPWFIKMDWDALYHRQLKAPIIPNIKNALDTSNFDNYADDKPQWEPYQDDGSNWDADF